ncbi:MAG: hypothetical protein PGN34_12830 [Methylobacterium frigidaeris]
MDRSSAARRFPFGRVAALHAAAVAGTFVAALLVARGEPAAALPVLLAPLLHAAAGRPLPVIERLLPAGVALAFAWADPGLGPFSLVLAAALALDAAVTGGLARLVAAGRLPGLGGFASLILPGPAAGLLAGAVLAAAAWHPAWFGLLAAGLAGLTLMGAVARATLAVIVLRAGGPEEP